MHRDKPNCSNTLIKFFNEDEQFVKNLNFYDPNIFEELEDNREISQKTSYKLFNVKKNNSEKERIKTPKNKLTKNNQSLSSSVCK